MSAQVPPPNSDVLSWAGDSKMATAEEEQWPNESAINNVKSKNDVLWHTWYGKIVVGLLLFFVLVFVVIASIVTWHYIMPDYWTWLSPDRLSKLQAVVFSGSIGSVITSVAKRQLSR